MTVQTLVLVLALGAALLALWVDLRFPRLAPTEFRPAIMHVMAALISAQLVMATGLTNVLTGSVATMVGGLLLLALPMLVYEFLAALWVIKLTQSIFRTYR